MSLVFAKVALVVGLVAGLVGCGDALDNSLGINGSPAWNRPFAVEGEWRGRFSLPVPTRAVGEPPGWLCAGNVALSVRDGRVTGQLVVDDGQRLTVTGDTWAGAWHTGDNLISAKVLRGNTVVGSLSYEPGRGANHMVGTAWLRGVEMDGDPCGSWTEISRVAR